MKSLFLVIGLMFLGHSALACLPNVTVNTVSTVWFRVADQNVLDKIKSLEIGDRISFGDQSAYQLDGDVKKVRTSRDSGVVTYQIVAAHGSVSTVNLRKKSSNKVHTFEYEQKVVAKSRSLSDSVNCAQGEEVF